MSYVEDLFSLENKVAVVIGGTGSLCGDMALGLAKAGCEVVIAGRSAEKSEAKLAAIRDAGGSAYFVETDISERASLEALLAEVLATSGKVDILINGATINAGARFLDITEESLDTILDANLKGVIRTCQVFGEYFIRTQTKASIINMGSISGVTPVSNITPYSAAKAALHNLTQALACEWAEHKIRVNTIIPGFFPPKERRSQIAPAFAKSILEKTPLERYGDNEELVGATLFLASNNASGFITGTEIIIDGGFNARSI